MVRVLREKREIRSEFVYLISAILFFGVFVFKLERESLEVMAYE